MKKYRRVIQTILFSGAVLLFLINKMPVQATEAEMQAAAEAQAA